MTPKPESGLQRRIQKALQAAFPSAYIRKIHVSEFSAAGMPDLICCIRGLFIAIEVKMPGKERTQLQEYNHSAIVKAGGSSMTIYTPEQAVLFCRVVIRDYYADLGLQWDGVG